MTTINSQQPQPGLLYDKPLDLFDVLPDYPDYIGEVSMNLADMGEELTWEAVKDTIMDFGKFPADMEMPQIDALAEKLAKEYMGED